MLILQLTSACSTRHLKRALTLVAFLPLTLVPVATAQEIWSAKPLTAEEEAAMFEAIEKAQAAGLASAAAGNFAGLDPTGMTQMALNAQTQAHAAEVQKYLPGMMAANLQRAQQYCQDNAQLPECQELRRTLDQFGAPGF